MACCTCILFWIVSILIILKLILKATTGKCWSNKYLGGKTVLITGGNSGLGYYTSANLASRGAKVIIASRSADENIKRKLIEETNNENIHVEKLDLSSLKSIRSFAKKIHESEEKIDILINNAGTATNGNTFTEDGFNSTMGPNHFGPFLLTILLLDLIRKSDKGRIVFTSSLAAYMGNIKSASDLTNKFYSSNTDEFKMNVEIAAYNNSKFCNVAVANHLAKLLKNTNITVNSCHPGAVQTPLFTKIWNNLPKPFAFLMHLLNNSMNKNAQEGAQTNLHLALDDSLDKVSGKYFIDCVQFIQPARDEELNKQIFEESAKLVKLTPEEKASLKI